MNAEIFLEKVEKYACSKCGSTYTFDEHGKCLAEKCCMCIMCGVESTYASVYCNKHKLEILIQNLQSSIEEDTKQLVKFQQELDKLNEPDQI